MHITDIYLIDLVNIFIKALLLRPSFLLQKHLAFVHVAHHVRL